MMDRRFAFAALVYCSAIFIESSHEIPYKVDQSLPGADKVTHALMYAGLTALISIGMRRSQRAYSPRIQFFVPIAFAMIYGASDEIHQHFVPSRSFDPWDELSNTAGAVLAQYYLFSRRWGLKL